MQKKFGVSKSKSTLWALFPKQSTHFFDYNLKLIPINEFIVFVHFVPCGTFCVWCFSIPFALQQWPKIVMLFISTGNELFYKQGQDQQDTDENQAPFNRSTNSGGCGQSR